MTRFVDVHNMIRWVRSQGPETIINELIQYLEDDFRRWPQFDKTPPRGQPHSVWRHRTHADQRP